MQNTRWSFSNYSFTFLRLREKKMFRRIFLFLEYAHQNRVEILWVCFWTNQHFTVENTLYILTGYEIYCSMRARYSSVQWMTIHSEIISACLSDINMEISDDITFVMALSYIYRMFIPTNYYHHIDEGIFDYCNIVIYLFFVMHIVS